MRTLYLDCAMGAAGDMLTAALLDLYEDREGFLREINDALSGKAEVTARADSKCGIRGLHVSVKINGEEEGMEHEGHYHDEEEHGHEGHHHDEEEHGHGHHHDEHGHEHHHHTSIKDIQELIGGMPVSENVRFHAEKVFESIASAEAQVHGQTMDHIHFHEVGTIDAVADVLGVCLLMEKLNPERVLCSPVNVGGGTVKCAHGILPVPAPATERLLRGIPWYGSEVRTELCTPTGAALVAHFADEFCDAPPMRVTKCGYGTGTKDLDRFNAVRALLGDTADRPETLIELQCNIDDMTGEEIGFAQERLLEAGALDVWTTPIGMKKSRPAVMISALCRQEQREEILRCFFQHSRTLGVREYACPRYSLNRTVRTVKTDLGEVRIKRAEGWNVVREKPEYEDLARIARENNLSLGEVREKLAYSL